ncbi:MAG: WbqC family protein [Bacteroidota bacterium]
MQAKLLPSTYFGPIDYFAHIVQSEKSIIEVEDNFQKQTYRNRCYIYGANGKLLLNVPVKHCKNENIRRKTNDTQIANEFDWQKLHWKSLGSAYRTSPYFEFYEDELRPLFEKKYKFLADLNMDTANLIQDIIQESWDLTKTTAYEESPSEILDLRAEFNAKKDSAVITPNYTQVFSDKFGFIPNLSILDLIFMEGPNALNYLESISLK